MANPPKKLDRFIYIGTKSEPSLECWLGKCDGRCQYALRSFLKKAPKRKT